MGENDPITTIAAITADVSGTIGLLILFIRSAIDYLNSRDTVRTDEPMVEISYRIALALRIVLVRNLDSGPAEIRLQSH